MLSGWLVAAALDARLPGLEVGLGLTCSLHCSSFLGLPYRVLIIYLVKPKKRNYNGDYRYIQCVQSKRLLTILWRGSHMGN